MTSRWLRNLVRRLLARSADFVTVGEIGDPRDVPRWVVREKPDVLFLDVQMPELSGFEVISLLEPEQIPLVIFVTAHEQFALDAFAAHAVDYLLKPIDEDRFAQALQKTRLYLAGHQNGELKERLLNLLEQLPMGPRFLSRLAVKPATEFGLSELKRSIGLKRPEIISIFMWEKPVLCFADG